MVSSTDSTAVRLFCASTAQSFTCSASVGSVRTTNAKNCILGSSTVSVCTSSRTIAPEGRWACVSVGGRSLPTRSPFSSS
eukprot:4412645-Prymnesium_polylepis.1